MTPVLSLNVSVSCVRPRSRRLQTLPGPRNHLLPKKKLGEKQTVSCSVAPTAKKQKCLQHGRYMKCATCGPPHVGVTQAHIASRTIGCTACNRCCLATVPRCRAVCILCRRLRSARPQWLALNKRCRFLYGTQLHLRRPMPSRRQPSRGTCR